MNLKKLDVIKLEDNNCFFLGKFEHIVISKINKVIFSKYSIYIRIGNGWINIKVPKTDYNLKQMASIGFKE